MALVTSTGIFPIGTRAIDFTLRGIDGKSYTLDSFREAEVLVIVFTCNHCPYAIAVEDRLIAIQHDYAPRGVRFVAINPNDAIEYPEDSFENMVKRAREKSFPYPYLHDESQETARAYHAACTPDTFVFDRARCLAYNGRIDDNWKEPARVTRHDLRMAIDHILRNEPVPFEPVPSMGCSIKWKR